MTIKPCIPPFIPDTAMTRLAIEHAKRHEEMNMRTCMLHELGIYIDPVDGYIRKEVDRLLRQVDGRPLTYEEMSNFVYETTLEVSCIYGDITRLRTCSTEGVIAGPIPPRPASRFYGHIKTAYPQFATNCKDKSGASYPSFHPMRVHSILREFDPAKHLLRTGDTKNIWDTHTEYYYIDSVRPVRYASNPFEVPWVLKVMLRSAQFGVPTIFTQYHLPLLKGKRWKIKK
ncbi:MAG: hypothetical protein RSE62_03550 [Citrobacter sp.]